MPLSIRLFVCSLAYLIAAAPGAHAETYWINPGAGAWGDQTNWSNGLPTAASAAAIFNGGTVQIIAGQDAVANSLQIGGPGKSSSFTFAGGSLTVPFDSIIGIGGTDAIGTATVSSGSTWTMAKDLTVGWDGTGFLNMSGGTVSCVGFYFAEHTGSAGTATISGGTLNDTGSFTVVGRLGTAELNLSGGAINSKGIVIGDLSGSSGTATISGGVWTSTFSIVSPVVVGNGGVGVLNITNTGTLTVNGPSRRVVLGQSNSGTLNIGTGGAAGTLNATEVVGGAGSALVNFNHTGTTTFAPNLTGSLSVAKLGPGTTILTGANTYTGATTISGGTLQIGDGGTTGTLGSAGVTNNGTLVFNRSDNLTVANAISGTGTLDKLGTGTLTLAGTNTYTGSTTIRGGTLVISGSLNSGPGEFHIGHNGNGMLNLAAGGSMTTDYAYLGRFSGDVGTADISGTWTTTGMSIGHAGPGTLNLLAGGTLNVNGTVHLGYNGVATGVLNIGNGGAAGTLNAPEVNGFFGGGTVNFNHTGNFSSGAAFTGKLAVVKSGSGTTTLSGSNTYTGTTTITEGTLTAASTTALSPNSAVIINGGTLILSALSATIPSLSGSGGKIELTGASLTVNQSTDTTYSGIITAVGGGGTLVKSGAGTLTLSGNNLPNAGISINGGTLKQGNSGALPPITPYTVNGGTLDLNGFNLIASHFAGTSGTVALGNGTLRVLQSDDSTYSGAMTGAGGLSLVKEGPGKLSLSGPGIAYTGATNVLRGSLEILDNFSFNSPIFIHPVATLTLNIANDVKLLQGVSGGGTINVTGTGATARLAGDNSGFTGTFTLPNIARGMMWSHPNAGSESASWNLSGAFAAIETGAGDTTTKLGALSGTHPFTKLTTFGGSGVKTLEIGALNTTSSFAGVISNDSQGGGGTGIIALTKVGTGTLTLSGVNTYTGPTDVLAGTLEIQKNTLFNSPIFLAAPAALTLNIANDVRLLQGVSGSGSINVTGTGATARLAGDNGGFTGTFSLPNTARGMMWSHANGGSALAAWNLSGEFAAIETGAGDTTTKLGALSGTNPATKLTTFGGSGVKTLEIGALNTASSFAGDISNDSQGGGGTGIIALTKVGTSTLTLSGVNTYTGSTTITEGTLTAASTTALSPDSAVIINGGTLILSALSATIPSLSGSGGAVSLGDAVLTVNQSTDTTYSGMITGPGGLVKSGAGTLTLTGRANTYNGSISINGGTLKQGTANALSGDQRYTVDGGTLDLNGFDLPAFHLTGASGTVALGNGTLKVNQPADSTYSGAMTGAGGLEKSSGGRLSLSGSGIAYTGATTVFGGSLEILDNFSFNSPIFIHPLATLTLNIANDVKLLQGVSGGGSINVTGTVKTARLAGDNSGFTGAFTLPATARGMMWSHPNAGSASASWDISGEFGFIETGGGNTTTKLGALSGSNSSTVIATFGGSGAKTLEIGALDTSTTFAGRISNSSSYGGGGIGIIALNKVGTGTLSLEGTNTYTGGTTVNGGILRVVGSISGAMTVNPGGTVEGAGTIEGDLNVSGGILAPGNGGIGTLHVLGGVNLFDTSTTLIELAGPGSFDQVSNGGGLIFDGTLQLSLVGGFQPSLGQTFELFPDATPAALGTFDSIIFSEPAYAGDFDPANGTLTIVAVPEPSTTLLLGLGLAGLAARRRKAQA